MTRGQNGNATPSRPACPGDGDGANGASFLRKAALDVRKWPIRDAEKSARRGRKMCRRGPAWKPPASLAGLPFGENLSLGDWQVRMVGGPFAGVIELQK